MVVAAILPLLLTRANESAFDFSFLTSRAGLKTIAFDLKDKVLRTIFTEEQ